MTELALGTANWGSSYGAPGREVTVLEPLAARLASAFVGAGHRLIDTAPAYGDAESLVGRVLDGAARVVTKLSPTAGRYDVDAALTTAQASVRRLRVSRLDGVLLHDPLAALGAPGDARSVLDALRGSGLADRAGVSVYTPEEALSAVELVGADLVQVPCNLLDQRFAGGCIAALADHGVGVHVRSVFLNGVLLAEPDELRGSLASLAEPVRRIRLTASRLNTTPLRLALSFVRDTLGAQAVVFGAFELEQLQAILAAWSAQPLPEMLWADLAAPPGAAIDPRDWQ